MPAYCRRLLDQAALSTGDALSASDSLDLADYKELEIVVEIHTAAEGDVPRLLVQHGPTAAVTLDFDTPIAIDLTVTGTQWLHASRFTRWLGWSITGTISSGAVVTMDVIAKP